MEITTATIGTTARVIVFLKKYILAKPFNFSPESISSNIRLAICEYQLLTTDYQFKLSQIHKSFKNCEDSELRKSNFEQLRKASESGFKIHADKLVKVIEQYFLTTRNLRIKPRVGVYLFEKGDSVKNILTNVDKKISDYSIFEELMDGNSYLDNCIPASAKRTDYRHAGMNKQRREAYKHRYIIDSKFIADYINSWKKSPLPERSWVHVSEDKESKSFYKSHLAVPITFKHHGNVLDESFLKLINLKENGRTILGFILIDHERPFYFDDSDNHELKNVDINVLYVLADIISFSFVTKLTYFDQSESVLDFIKTNTKTKYRKR